MTRAGYLLESAEPLEDEVHHLRANYRHGVRCLSCGRKLDHIQKLPAVRTCPNSECRSTYHLSRGEKSLILRKV
jgi:DNA-directed RNA polymerase subunit RPC12/RpoP